jgi:hypothetical protein
MEGCLALTVALLAGCSATPVEVGGAGAGSYIVLRSTVYREGAELSSRKIGVLRPGTAVHAREERWLQGIDGGRRLRRRVVVDGGDAAGGVEGWVSERSARGRLFLAKAAPGWEQGGDEATRKGGREQAAATATGSAAIASPGSHGTALLESLGGLAYVLGRSGGEWGAMVKTVVGGISSWHPAALWALSTALTVVAAAVVATSGWGGAADSNILNGFAFTRGQAAVARTGEEALCHPCPTPVPQHEAALSTAARRCPGDTVGGSDGAPQGRPRKQSLRWAHSKPRNPRVGGTLGHARRPTTIDLKERLPPALRTPAADENPQDYIAERGNVMWQTEEEESVAFDQLKERVAHLRGPQTQDFLTDGTLMRYLRAQKGAVEVAAAMLHETVQWRAACQPAHIDCALCCERVGSHTWRQVGFDKRSRPIVYSCPRQEPPGTKQTAVESNMHIVFMLEEAAKTMAPGVEQWFWALDMSGFSFRHADPRLAQHMGPLFAQHYPERLGLALIINAPRIFTSFWGLVRKFVDPNTVAKVQFVKTGPDLRATLDRVCNAEMAEWLETEIQENSHKRLSETQQRWWQAPELSGGAPSAGTAHRQHDPRACPSFVSEYLDPTCPPCGGTRRGDHRPHPSIREQCVPPLPLPTAVPFPALQLLHAVSAMHAASPTTACDCDRSAPSSGMSLPCLARARRLLNVCAFVDRVWPEEYTRLPSPPAALLRLGDKKR